MSTSQGRIFPLVFTVLQLLHSPSVGENTIKVHCHVMPLPPLPFCACVCVPVQFTDGSQPADVAPAAGQDGQVVGVQREEEALGGELGL